MFNHRQILCSIIFILTLVVGAISLPAGPALAGTSIYDAEVLRYLKLASGQRSKVRRIVRQSDSDMAKVFRKYGINPRKKPDFDKLWSASSALQAIESRERKAMKKILNKDQLKQYDHLIDVTRIRVRKAAN